MKITRSSCRILKNEELLIGYDSKKAQYYIDRTKSGKVDFNKDFAGRFFAPCLVSSPASNIKIIVDHSSVELSTDGGLTVMTSVFFPNELYHKIRFSSSASVNIKLLRFRNLKSIWR